MDLRLLVCLISAGCCLAEIELPNAPTNLDDVPVFKEKCDKFGKSDTYDRLKVALNETKTCLEGKIDLDKVKEELDEAKKTGSMDEVFAKYCNKRNEYKECILKSINVTKECMEPIEIQALDTVIEIAKEVGDFACYRDGDRLAMFVAEGGIRCIKSRTEGIQQCIKTTLNISTANATLTDLPNLNLPSFKIDKEKCDKLTTVWTCVVNDLENKCDDVTPANIVDALFRFIKKTACKNIQ